MAQREILDYLRTMSPEGFSTKDLAERFKLNQSSVSTNLSVLRRHRLVISMKINNTPYYAYKDTKYDKDTKEDVRKHRSHMASEFGIYKRQKA